MDNKTVLSDNELIASFMGARVRRVAGPLTGEWYYEVKLTPNANWQNAHYDTSWDWLMPVVEKIENIRHIGIDAVYFQIRGRQAQIWTYFDVKEFLRMTGDDKNDGNKFKVGHSAKTKIEATYHACLDFIKWYNSTKTL